MPMMPAARSNRVQSRPARTRRRSPTVFERARSARGTSPSSRATSARSCAVSEQEIIEAMRFVWERVKIVIEPSSAVAVAPLLDAARSPPRVASCRSHLERRKRRAHRLLQLARLDNTRDRTAGDPRYLCSSLVSSSCAALDVRLLLFLGAVPLFLAAGRPALFISKLAEEMANPETIVPICSAMGFAYVLRLTECDQHLVLLLVRPLRRMRALLIPGGIAAGYLINTTIVSQAATAAVLGPVLIPLAPRRRSGCGGCRRDACCSARRWEASSSIPAPSRSPSCPS